MTPDPKSESSPRLGSLGRERGSSAPMSIDEPPQASWRGGWRYLSMVTVEPALFLIVIGYGIEMVFKTNMLVDKICSVQLNYSSEVCRDLDSGNYKAQQDAVQRLTTNYNLYCQLIELLPGAVVMILLGTWSDTRGRRLPLLLPLAGSTLKSLGLCCCVYWWSSPTLYVALSYIPLGLSGGIMAIFMAAYAYVSDDSGLRGRTTRLSLVGMSMLVALPLGNALGTVVFPSGGYTAVFALDFITSLLGIVYGVIRLTNKGPKSAPGSTQVGKVTPLSKLRRSLGVVFRRRAGGGRASILGHGSGIVLYMVTVGVNNFMFLFTRYKFQWNYKQFSAWNICNCVVSVIATCVLVPLLSYRWHIDDTILAFSGAAFHVFFGVLIGTATDPWILYLGVALSAGGGITIIGSRGAISKLVTHDELGAVFSVVGVFESLAPVITSPIYTLVYNNTLDVFPGTVFLISAAVTVVICCIYTWLATAHPAPPEAGSKERT
ncbi:Proton-coupled folate transporter [Chionoecetes opilio]|uniref:Proton-coupled folate transporter n=1 Tax=Chionoecetes opilio TaxID=41210 RepID=A0A8J4YJM6_CHIOP|nr:Proton-coupled folate transporter [Chionoecetes opilio]